MSKQSERKIILLLIVSILSFLILNLSKSSHAESKLTEFPLEHLTGVQEIFSTVSFADGADKFLSIDGTINQAIKTQLENEFKESKIIIRTFPDNPYDMFSPKMLILFFTITAGKEERQDAHLITITLQLRKTAENGEHFAIPNSNKAYSFLLSDNKLKNLDHVNKGISYLTSHLPSYLNYAKP